MAGFIPVCPGIGMIYACCFGIIIDCTPIIPSMMVLTVNYVVILTLKKLEGTCST